MGNPGSLWPNSNAGKLFRIKVWPRGTDPKATARWVEAFREVGRRLDIRLVENRDNGLVRESRIAHELAADIRRRIPTLIVETEKK